MKKTKLLLVAITIIASYSLSAQMAVTTDGSSADASAMFEIKSTEKGMLIPRMTRTEIAEISNPANGLMVFNTTDDKFYAYILVDNEWKEISYGTGTITLWTCGDAIIDSRDSKSYTTVQIGTQCWMAENINIGTRIDGSGNQTDNATIEKYCYDNSTANCDTYGGLYQWDEMMQYETTEGTQGICPTGWHLPTDAEWCTLENYVDAGAVSCSATGLRGTDVGGNLKETGTTHWATPNTGATNSSGFTVLPGGWRNYSSGSFALLTTNTYFWSSSENGSDAWSRILKNFHAQVDRSPNNQAYGFSVRCVRD